MFEILEPRQLMSAYLVDNIGDLDDGDFGAGQLTLREAIALTNANSEADTISFASALNGQTITLGGSALSITGDYSDAGALSVIGPGAGLLTVSGAHLSHVFAAEMGARVSISGLTITGGGIFSIGSLTLTDNVISGNGTGVVNSSYMDWKGSLTIDRCVISNNTDGGIDNSGGLQVSNSTISGNSTTGAGGGIDNWWSLTLTNSTVSGNSALKGGGIANHGATATITNSTIAGNSATEGGGIFNEHVEGWRHGPYYAPGISDLYNSTVAGSAALDTGGGVSFDGDASTIQSSIVAGNTRGAMFRTPDDFFFSHPGTLDSTSTNSLIGDAASAGGLVNGVNGNIVGFDARLAPLADNGGPTQTMAILNGSPAINAGINPKNLASDQRGSPFARGTVVDIGAYQRQTPTLVVDTLGDADDGDSSAGHLTLREAVNLSNARPGADLVSFAAAVYGQTITLSGTALTLSDGVSIDGPGPGLLAVSGDSRSLVLDVSWGVSAAISGLTVTNGTFSGGHGGGILNSGALTVANSSISENGGHFVEGGGIYNESGATLTLSDSTVSKNYFMSSLGGQEFSSGSGIVNDGTATVADSTVSENVGGGVLNRGTLTVTRSTISGNSKGGGVWNSSDAVLTLTNSTVSGNTDRSGIHTDGALTLHNSTITGNGDEGGLYVGSGQPMLVSTIVAGNTGGDVVHGTLGAGSTHNLIGDAASAGGLVNGVDGNILGVDPLLGPLARNGGPTKTHALLAGSPAIDGGSNPSNLTTDQRGAGFARINGASPDIGALETGSALAGYAADWFIDVYMTTPRAADGLVDGDWIADTLRAEVPDVYTSDAYWGARNHWFEDSNGDVWSLWQGGGVHASTTLPGQHEWVLTSLTDAAGLSGSMHFDPGSLSGITTGWNAFTILGIQDGRLVALWWSPAGSAGTYIDTDGSTRQGSGLGVRGNGWVLSNISEAATSIGGALTTPPSGFLPYTESQGNGRTEFDPRATRLIANTGMSVVVVDAGHRVYAFTFSVSQRPIAGARPDLNGAWAVERLRELPSLADFGLDGQLDSIEQAYVDAATM